MILLSQKIFIETAISSTPGTKLHWMKMRKLIKKTEKSLKRKALEDDLNLARHQKIIISDAIDALRKGLIHETKRAEQNQDLSGIAKAAALCTGIISKEKELKSCKEKISGLIKLLTE